MSFNIFSFILGDPSPAADRAAFDAAVRDLKAARRAGNRVAEQAALSRMKAAGARLHASSKKATDNVARVDSAADSIKQGLPTVGRGAMLIGGAILLVLIMKK